MTESRINLGSNIDSTYSTNYPRKIDLNLYIYGGIPQKEEVTKRQLLIVMFSIGFFYAGFNLALFFDTVFLKLYLCSPQIFNCNFSNINDFEILKANSYYNLLRTAYLIPYLMFLLIGGVLSDNIRTKNENRLPVILIGSIIASFGYFIAPFIIPFNIGFSMIIYGVIGSGFGLAIGPELSLISSLFLKEERGWAAVGLSAFGSLGVILGIIINESIINPYLLLSEFSSINWYVVWIVISIIIFVLGFLTFYLTPKYNPPFPGNGIVKDLLQTPKLIISLGKTQTGENNIESERDFLLMLVISIFWGGAGFLLTSNLSNFINDLRLFHFITIDPGRIYLLIGFFGAVFAIPVAYLITKYGKVYLGIFGTTLMFLFSILISLQFLWNDMYFVTLMVLNGFGTVVISTVSLSLSADLVPRGKEGQMMGIIIFTMNLLSPISSLIISLTVGQQTDLLSSYIIIFLFIALLYVITLPFLLMMKYDKWIESQYWEFYHRYLHYRGIIKKNQDKEKL